MVGERAWNLPDCRNLGRVSSSFEPACHLERGVPNSLQWHVLEGMD